MEQLQYALEVISTLSLLAAAILLFPCNRKLKSIRAAVLADLRAEGSEVASKGGPDA